MSCEPPFWKDLNILFKDFSLQYNPDCSHSPWNFIARLLIVGLFVGMIGSVLGGLSVLIVTLLFALLTGIIIIITTKTDTKYNSDTHQENIMPDNAYSKKQKHKQMQNQKQTQKHNDSYHSLPYIANVDPGGYLTPLAGAGFGGGVEGFINGGSTIGSVQPNTPSGFLEIDASPYSGPMLPDYTPPKARNLFMNVLLDEIKYNPDRPEASSVNDPTVKQTFDDYFRVQWFSDPTDVFGKNQNQRQFVTQPSTTIPNDQGAFANWLYKIPGKTCKEGGRDACLAGTDGGPVTWLNQSS